MPRLSRRSLLLSAAVAATAGPLAAVARAATRTPKVLVIGLDGALLSRIKDATAPNLGALTAAGLTAPSSIDEFWTQAQRDQNREGNVRARNVFAVADGDEWTDKSFTGAFDSTLVSPAYPVTGGGRAVLTYTTYYRHESPQKGEVLVSYDGGTPVSVRTYTADVPSRTETVSLQVPAGATSARVRFRYTGGDNWYWVIDGVRIDRS
ncbi:hypothetical protein [Streptomyces sp. NPDC002343]